MVAENDFASMIKNKAMELGFSSCGVSDAAPFEEFIENVQMNLPAASSGVSKTKTGRSIRRKRRGIYPKRNKHQCFLRTRPIIYFDTTTFIE